MSGSLVSAPTLPPPSPLAACLPQPHPPYWGLSKTRFSEIYTGAFVKWSITVVPNWQGTQVWPGEIIFRCRARGPHVKFRSIILTQMQLLTFLTLEIVV